MTNSCRVALPNVLKTRFFDTVSTALRSIFVASQIGDREVILRVVANLFPSLRSGTNGQILNWRRSFDVVFEKCQEKLRNRRGSNRGQHYG